MPGGVDPEGTNAASPFSCRCTCSAGGGGGGGAGGGGASNTWDTVISLSSATKAAAQAECSSKCNKSSSGSVGGYSWYKSCRGSVVSNVEYKFFVRLGETGDSTADNCGCQHSDLYSEAKGEVRTGFGGSTDPEHAPDNPTTFKPGKDVLLSRNFSGTLGYGAAAGKACDKVTADDIDRCIRAYPKPPNGSYNVFTNNCRTDVSNAAKACCLKGW